MNDLLTKDETIDRFEFQFVFERSFNQNLGLIFSNGERWKKVRRFTLRKLRDFGLGKRDQMDEIIRAEVGLLTNHMKEEIRAQEGPEGRGAGCSGWTRTLRWRWSTAYGRWWRARASG